MTVRLFREDDRESWDRYVSESGHSSCYHQAGWKDVIEKSFGHRTYYLLSEDGQKRINGILPLAHFRSILFGSFMVSLPYFNYGGICAESEEVGEQLLMSAIDIAEREKASHIELRHTSRIKGEMPMKTEKVSMRLGLPGNSDELWESFRSKLRSQIRRPIREGMYALIGGREELDSFYTVLSSNMRDLGTPVYPKEFFGNILSEFSGTTWIGTIYSKDRRPVASGFLVGFEDKLEIPWASSLRSYNHYSPNMLLYWEMIRFACDKGYGIFDFGRCTPGEGTYRFKEQWMARPLQLYWHYWMRNGGRLPELNPRNPKYRMAIKLWKRLPVNLTRLLGPRIVKDIP